MGTAADRPGPKKLDRLSDGVVAPVNAGVGAIDPSAERLDRTARADGIGGSAVGQYSPQFFSQEEGNTMALALPGRQARVPSTPLPSGQLESLRPTASEVLPSDNIPPPFFAQEEGNTMALALPGRQARVPSTPLPSGQVESLGPTASKSEPSEYIPPPQVGSSIYPQMGRRIYPQVGRSIFISSPCWSRRRGI